MAQTAQGSEEQPPRHAALRAERAAEGPPERLETASAVHLIFRVDRDWEAERAEAVAEVEAQVEGLLEYARSPAFQQRHGARTGVLRLRTRSEPPTIVVQVLQERGVEVEVEDRPRPQPGQRCELCARTGFEETQVTMTGQGWACPSCARAWALQQAPPPRQPGRLEQRLRSGKTLMVALVALLLLCLYGVYYTLSGMSHMNHVIRTHLPQ